MITTPDKIREISWRRKIIIVVIRCINCLRGNWSRFLFFFFDIFEEDDSWTLTFSLMRNAKQCPIMSTRTNIDIHAISTFYFLIKIPPTRFRTTPRLQFFFERIYRTKNAFFLSHVIFISGDNRKLGKYFRKRVEKKKSDWIRESHLILV